jgi:hypothetical protein
MMKKCRLQCSGYNDTWSSIAPQGNKTPVFVMSLRGVAMMLKSLKNANKILQVQKNSEVV